MSDLRLSLAMGDYDRTRAIYDGRVKIDGVDPICMLQSPEEMFFRAFLQRSGTKTQGVRPKTWSRHFKTNRQQP